jgi:flagellar FliJ protein
MARAFSLAGLLRLRHLQQEQAEARLSGAHAILRENAERRSRTRAALGATPIDAFDVSTLDAIAAARASSRSMVADLDALRQTQQADVDAARAAYEEARARSIGLEKLQTRHAVAVANEELHAEQAVIDEIASTSWHRATPEATR